MGFCKKISAAALCATFLLLSPSCVGPKRSLTKKERLLRSVFLSTGIKLEWASYYPDLDSHKVPTFNNEEVFRHHFEERKTDTKIKALVMHYTHCDFMRTIGLFTSGVLGSRVSAHYVITERERKWYQRHGMAAGHVIEIVPEDKTAWHAGISKWQDSENLNHYSIGIENVSRGYIGRWKKDKFLWIKFDRDQIAALGRLSRDIIARHNINPTRVVGHSDIAPGRKMDPGILFPWGQLYEEYGVGAWLEPHERSVEYIKEHFSPDCDIPTEADLDFLAKQLCRYGYNLLPRAYDNDEEKKLFENVLLAFKMHFSENQNPKGFSRTPTYNDQLWIWGLVAKYKDFLPKASFHNPTGQTR